MLYSRYQGELKKESEFLYFCKMESLLIELQYFPNIQYFSKLLYYPNILIEQHENYIKRSYRNRTHIATANGLLRLSIPLEKGKNQQKSIKEVRINYDENWQKKHWTAICSAYGNAPFFEYYIDDFRPFFEEKTTFLFEYNLAILKTLFFVLDVQVHLQFTETYMKTILKPILDFRNKISPKIQTENLDTSFQNLAYPQVFQEKSGFISNLSILDLLFCKGPESVYILEQSFMKA